MDYMIFYWIGYVFGFVSTLALISYLVVKVIKYIIKLCKGDENE